jgi:hypothetical protein
LIVTVIAALGKFRDNENLINWSFQETIYQHCYLILHPIIIVYVS